MLSITSRYTGRLPPSIVWPRAAKGGSKVSQSQKSGVRRDTCYRYRWGRVSSYPRGRVHLWMIVCVDKSHRAPWWSLYFLRYRPWQTRNYLSLSWSCTQWITRSHKMWKPQRMQLWIFCLTRNLRLLKTLCFRLNTLHFKIIKVFTPTKRISLPHSLQSRNW